MTLISSGPNEPLAILDGNGGPGPVITRSQYKLDALHSRYACRHASITIRMNRKSPAQCECEQIDRNGVGYTTAWSTTFVLLHEGPRLYPLEVRPFRTVLRH